MSQIYERRKSGGRVRVRDGGGNLPTERYKNRAEYDNMRVGNIGKGYTPWTEGEDDLLLRDLTHREIVAEIFKKFGKLRSRAGVRMRCRLVKDKLKGKPTKGLYKSADAFIERKKLTIKNFRPFDEGHMYGYKA